MDVWLALEELPEAYKCRRYGAEAQLIGILEKLHERLGLRLSLEFEDSLFVNVLLVGLNSDAEILNSVIWILSLLLLNMHCTGVWVVQVLDIGQLWGA